MVELEREAPKWDRGAAKLGEKHRVFCGSMCDWAEGRSDQRPSLDRLFPLIERTTNLNWLLLTKRPNIGTRLLAEYWEQIPRNVWVGTTIENQEWADKRLPHLLSIDASVRFVSVEPQLGAVDLRAHLGQGSGKINWVICGGESGAKARGRQEMLGWYRSLRDQCVEAGVSYFFKQWGRFAQEGEQIYKLRGKNPDNILDGLRWEQYPDAPTEPKPGIRTRPRTHLDVLLSDEFDSVA